MNCRGELAAHSHRTALESMLKRKHRRVLAWSTIIAAVVAVTSFLASAKVDSDVCSRSQTEVSDEAAYEIACRPTRYVNFKDFQLHRRWNLIWIGCSIPFILLCLSSMLLGVRKEDMNPPIGDLEDTQSYSEFRKKL